MAYDRLGEIYTADVSNAIHIPDVFIASAFSISDITYST